MQGMLQPLGTPCRDHEGAHKARIPAWDGGPWNYTSDRYESGAKLLHPMMEAAAKKYAQHKNIQARDCGAEG